MWLTSFLSNETARTLGRSRRLAEGLSNRGRIALTTLYRLRIALQQYRMVRAAMHDLYRLGDRALDDIGLAREDVPRVARDMTARHFATAAGDADTATRSVLAANDAPKAGCCAGT